jgi:outer membrane protein OmpA-like peptidoglycan-associated protein/opacity protein-like surface antigen
VLGAAIPTLAQTTAPAQAPSPEGYSIYEINPFAGYQWFMIPNRDSARAEKYNTGAAAGFRVTEDWWKYVGLEESLTIGFNKLEVYPTGLQQTVGAGNHNFTFAVDLVAHFTPRESKFRPFVAVGPGLTFYKTTYHFNIGSVPGVVPPLSNLESEYGPSVNYGAGIKYNITKSLGLRFDFRGLRTQGREFGLPTVSSGPGTIYISHHDSENGWAVTGGVSFRFGHRSDYVPPPPPPPPPPPKPVANIRITGVTGAHDACPGENVLLEAAANGWLADQTPTYQWTMNGQPVAGANSSSFSVPTQDGSGVKNITVTVSAPGSSQTSTPVAVRVKNYAPPTVQFALSRSSIAFGDKLPLAATARASECGGATTLRYTASDGAIAGSVFDSSTLAFDPANRLKQQTKVVHLTATATDEKRGTGSASADLTVTLSTEARRLDDIIFPANSARVNNCAKRLLMEQLTPMLRDDPNATVILIGHRDEREKGKAASKLDRVRTLNAAAVLSAGTGICPLLELNRVKVNWVGADQSSSTRPLFCGTSTDVKEKSGQAVKSSDQRAQFRRVEVWIVPGGAAMPAGISGLQDVPAAEVKKLGCPK